MRAPPKTHRKLNVEAMAELGTPRTCTECGDTKEVSAKTFTPSNHGFRGWKTVCKVCEALSTVCRASNHRGSSTVNAELAACADIDLIPDMYFLHLTLSGDKARLDEVVKELGRRVRELAEAGEREKSFRLFIDIIRPLISNWVTPGAIHDDIIAGLLSQHRRRLILATRYSAKSTLTAVYVTWRIFLDPLIKIMAISRGEKLAARMLRTVRHVFLANCPMLGALVPNDDCLDNAEQFQVPQTLAITTGGATFTSLGITSNLPGFRSDLTIGDDVEGRQDDTPEKVEALEEILNELHMINPLGEKIMLGTYQSEYSVYAKLADKADADGLPVWEAHRACMFEEDVLDGEKVIHSRWPEMFSDVQAKDWRTAVTERAWRLHAMLIADPKILNERPLKIGNFILVKHPAEADSFPLNITAGGIVRDDVPKWGAPKGDDWTGPLKIGTELSRYAQTVVAIDPASGLAGRDAIGLVVLSTTASGHGIIRHLEGIRGPDKLGNIKRAASLIAKFEATQVVVEELADGLFGETLEGLLITVNHPMLVHKVTTGGQLKGRRIIETLAPPMAAGRLILLESVARSDHGGDFVNQLIRCSWDGRTGKAREHDDIVDALAHAVAAVKGSLIGDISSNVAEHFIESMDHWRGLPLRLGGLGTDGERGKGSRAISMYGDGLDIPMGERLLEEDQVLVRLETKMAHLQDTILGDLRAGRMPDSRMRDQVAQIKTQIDELRSLQVL